MALHTAVLSIEGLEPSRKELNIFGLRPPVFACSGVRPVMSPDGIGRGLRKMRQPLVPAPGGDHRKTRRARPVDQLADQRRLIAVGQAVDHAGRLRLLREQRAAQSVGLHRHVDHVLAMGERSQAMLHRSGRIAGALRR